LKQRSFIQNENAVSTVISYALFLIILMIFTGGIIAAFYSYSDSSSEQASRTGFTDLGSEIARDITNIFLTSEHSPNNVTLSIKRDIPLTMGGRGYSIELMNSSQTGGMASIHIKDGGFFSYPVNITLNSITEEVDFTCAEVVYSGSGRINITMTKTNDGIRELCIK
jgi:hypothetical protein